MKLRMSSVSVTVGEKTYADLEHFNLHEALALQLIFLSANYSCYGRRGTCIDPTGRHAIAFSVAAKLVKRDLLKSRRAHLGELRGKPFIETQYCPTERGEQAATALEKHGWSLEWLKEQIES